MRGEAKLAWIIPSAADIIKNVKTQKINILRWDYEIDEHLIIINNV